MRFVQHPSNNRVLGAPKNWNQDQLECGALPVTDMRIEGQPVMVSFWSPDADDLRKLAAGGKIMLYVYGTAHPPVAIDVEGAL